MVEYMLSVDLINWILYIFDKAKDALISAEILATDNRDSLHAKEFSADGHYGLDYPA